MTIKRAETIHCDGDKCTHVKDQDSNHWLTGYDGSIFILIGKGRDAFPQDASYIPDPSLNPNKFLDFCGEECAIRWVSKQLTEIKKS